ncbi:MAG: VanZ family protein [Bacteroidota bacterium]
MTYSLGPYAFIRYQLPAILWALAIYISSSIPTIDLPTVDVPSFDKAVHFFIFFMLAAFTHRAIRFQNKIPLFSSHHVLSTVLFVVIYGFADEFHQYFVPGRNPSIFDLVADAVGAFLYLGIFMLLRYRRSRSVVQSR